MASRPDSSSHRSAAPGRLDSIHGGNARIVADAFGFLFPVSDGCSRSSGTME